MRDKVTLFGKPYTPNMATQWAAMCAEEFQAAQKDEVWWTRLKDVFEQIPGNEPDFVKFVRLYWMQQHKRDDPNRSLGSFLSRESYCEREKSEIKGRGIVIAAMHILASKGFFIPNGLSFQKSIYQYIYNLDRDDGVIRGIDVCVVEYAEIQRKEQEREARFQDRRVEASAPAKVYSGEGVSPTTADEAGDPGCQHLGQLHVTSKAQTSHPIRAACALTQSFHAQISSGPIG